jgi:hypothetical protein
VRIGPVKVSTEKIKTGKDLVTVCEAYCSLLAIKISESNRSSLVRHGIEDLNNGGLECKVIKGTKLLAKKRGKNIYFSGSVAYTLPKTYSIYFQELVDKKFQKSEEHGSNPNL